MMRQSLSQSVFLIGIALLVCAEPVASFGQHGGDQHSKIPVEQPFKEAENNHDEIDLEIEKLKKLFSLTLSLDSIEYALLSHEEYLHDIHDLLESQYLATPDVSRGPPRENSAG